MNAYYGLEGANITFDSIMFFNNVICIAANASGTILMYGVNARHCNAIVKATYGSFASFWL